MPFNSKVLQLNIPTPFPVGSVNVYAIQGPEGYYLIDAGAATDEARSLIDEWLPGPLSGILITHGHPDHLGLAGELAKANNCPVCINFEEYQRSQNPSFRDRVMSQLMEKGGVPTDLVIQVVENHKNSIRDFMRKLDDVEVMEILPGQKFATELGPLEVLNTPGHSLGHCCFYLTESKILFSGDHVLASISPNPLLDLTMDGKRRLAYVEYLDSIDKIASLSVERAFPGHGTSFDNLDNVIRRFHIFHAKREKGVLAALSHQLKTPFEVAQKIYPGVRDLDIFLALSRVWGHLDLLEQQGKVSRLEKSNITYYSLG